MRHYAYFLATCLALITLVCSCAMEDKADEATPRLRVSQKSLSVVKTGKLKDGTSATFQVAANKGYRISSDAEWLSVDKPEGVGLVDVAVVCQENNSGAERTASLYVTADGGLKDTVLVSQSLFDPDVALPRTFYSDDFSWTEPIAAANNLKDPVGDPDNGYTRMEVTNPAAADAWAACGLIDWYKTAVNPNGANKINIQNGYLCFNSNKSFNTGVILPVLTDISDDESANATGGGDHRRLRLALRHGRPAIRDGGHHEGGHVEDPLVRPLWHRRHHAHRHPYRRPVGTEVLQMVFGQHLGERVESAQAF